MMKRLPWMMVVLGTLGLAACSDDSSKVTNKDLGRKDKTSAINKDKSTTTGDQSTTIAFDKNVVVKADTTTAKKDTTAAPACTPFVAKANTGKLCKADTECGADELCLPNDAGTQGECTGKCCVDKSKPIDDPANLCPVADAAKMKSFCFWTMVDDKQQPLGYNACMFLCSFTDGAGKTTTYTCPNATDACVKSQEPTISYCDPK